MRACDRCGRRVEDRRLKEVVYEEGRTRVREMVCPNCLDRIMNESARVRGVAGTEKHAAVHIDRKTVSAGPREETGATAGGPGEETGATATVKRQSLGDRHIP